MTENSDKLIRGLWPLPGGNKRYLETLNRILKWVASTSDVTEEELIQWLMSQYNVKKGSAIGYVRVVLVLGALEIPSGQIHLIITPLGQAVLDAEGQAKASLVVDRFMQDYLGFREVLAVYNRSNDAIHLDQMVERLQPYFVRWTSPAQFEYRALWLLSLGVLEQERGRYYVITDFGRKVAAQYPPIRDIDGPPPEPVVKVEQPAKVSGEPEEELDIVTALTYELQEAATDSQNPQRLEQAVAEALEYLGYSVDHLGMSGETDVLARANIGEESYIIAVDAKARGKGKVQNLDMFTLLDHKRQNEADHAVVVAGEFAGGKVVNHAVESGVVLLSVPLFAKWLFLHAQTPLNLSAYRAMFTKPGLLVEMPDAVELAADNQVKWGALLVDLIELINEAYYEHGLNEALPRDQMFYMLMTRLRGVRYSKEEVQQGIEFLTHPALGAMLAEENAISLAMNRKTLALTLRKLADRIETVDTETDE